jgi:KAP family P-loop domain
MEMTAVNSTLVDLGGLKLEPHVRAAFEDAWRSSRGRPLNAADLLRAAIRTGRSEAFRELASMFHDVSARQVGVPDLAPLNLNAVPLGRPLAESFAIAEGFVMDAGGMWGRDLVAMALLAHNDQSLEGLVKESGLTVGQAQQRWLDFVRRGDKHRAPQEWDQWWRAAGSSPESGKTTPTGGEQSYLLTWNPARYTESQLEERIRDRDSEGAVSFGWSSGNNQSMRTGERVFLLRQGEASKRGLVGVGRVIRPPEQRPHWDAAERARGRESWIVDVRWEAIAVDPSIEVSTLRQATGEHRLWATQVGGVRVEPTTADVLERLWPGAWERHMHALDPLRPLQLTARQLIATFDPDTTDRDVPDSLHIDRYVDAFARVAASKDLRPPLSVGIFGDWGAGKSYFMDRVRERIGELTRPDEGGEKSDPYLRHVCQVEFNAWHYAETDLWASLVSTLFHQLRRFLDPPSSEGDASEGDEFNKLLNALEIATALQAVAKKRLEDAQRQLKAAHKAVQEAEAALADLPPPRPPTDDELRALLGKTVKEALSGSASEPATAELASLFQDAYELTGRAEFDQAREGVENGTTTVEQAALLVDDAGALASRAGFWWRLLTAANLLKSPRFWLVALAILAVPFVFVLIQSQIEAPIGWAAALSQLAAMVGALVVWARTTLARAAPMLNRLDWAQAAIQRKIDEAKTEDQRAFELAQAEAARAESDAQSFLETAQRQLRDTTEAVEAAEAALKESRSDARLSKFIQDRASSTDYAHYLGLIAMIHRDFDTMSRLMAGVARGDHTGLPRVDRIVLYIDDLDRCYPPERVVRVLEAVHLLLFFPMFVVFVGVDSRWVSRSLNRYYDQLLSDESIKPDNTTTSTQREPANSQDFLEKIFQVPFWLRRMDPPAVQRMIHSLITSAEIETDEGSVTEVSGEGPAADLQSDLQGSRASAAPQPRKAHAQTVATEAELGGAALGEPELSELPTEALRISQIELDFMDKVAPLMPRTPRSVKRFVNIYRLYKAALSTPALARFLGTPEHVGNFRAVQVLLAFVTGTPEFAKAVVTVLNDLSETDDATLATLAARIPSDTKQQTWQTTLDALAKFAQGDNDLRLTELREVSPLVTRYSVHHMISELPGKSNLG